MSFRTFICQILLWICYYYSRCFGTVTYCISHRNKPETNSVSFHAYEKKYLIWLTIVQRTACCGLFYYASFMLWQTKDVFFNRLTVLQATSIVCCTLSVAVAQFRYSGRSVVSINKLFKLIYSIRELHPNYEIFQWSHASLLTVIVICFMYEIGCIVEGVLREETLLEIAIFLGNIYLLIGVWLNLHVASILYICIDALYGAFNNYMTTEFLLKLREAQVFAEISVPSPIIEQLIVDLSKCLKVYRDINYVGQELHNTLQIPIVSTILYMYTLLISIVYFLIWKYFETDLVLWYYVILILKLSADIVLVSLTAHKAIKSSHILCRIGLESAILSENHEWHTHMELFLYHINLHDFKLSILGLFEITNALTLTFISGMLTSLTIILPFSIKLFRMNEIFISK